MNLQLLRFLAVGIAAVAIDFASYSLLLALDLAVAPSKAMGFLAGAGFAYVVNRDWTFQAAGGVGVLLRFSLLYFFGLCCNVVVNVLALTMLESSEAARAEAFLAAASVSASISFLGMKFLVFNTTPKGAPS